MTKEDAIEIIRKEYKCVDRDCDIDRSCGKCDLMMPNKEPILKAYEMAIKALSGEKEKGRWIQQEFIGVWTHNYKCSICGGMVCCCELDQPEYCGHCGAEMESAE